MAWNKGGWQPGGDDAGVSKYNSGLLTNQRLHNLWCASQNHWRKGEINQVNDCLDLVWVELFADAPPIMQDKIKEFDKTICELTENIKTLKILKELLAAKSQLAIAIKNKFLFLKVVEKKQGRGIAYKDEDEDDFD